MTETTEPVPPAPDTPSPAPDTVPVPLTKADIGLLIEALDSHAYWQLCEPRYRNSGYVLEAGETPEIRECYALTSKLEEARR